MNQKKWLAFFIAFALIASTAGALSWSRANQRLGQPGIKATPIPGSVMMTINLPERVLDFTSTNVPEPKIVVDYLPLDTSYASRLYTDAAGLQISSTVILMGGDRTSIHKPDYCLPGQGWKINAKSVVNVPVPGNPSYELPVARWVISNSFKAPDGRVQEVSGLYVFWFVADGEQTTDNYQRMWWMGRDLLRTGVLQRWAYISYFAICAPGQEEATFERMKYLIGHSVAEYQKPPIGR
ncbi:MAG: exosortase-associated EpsI family protein [Limisphaerales bacterium]